MSDWLARRYGQRATLLPAALFMAICLLTVLWLPVSMFGRTVVVVLGTPILVYLAFQYASFLVRGEGGVQVDVGRLLSTARAGRPDARADALNQLWGALDRMTAIERDTLAALARDAVVDPDGGVRGQAIFALGELRNANDLPQLEHALRDAEWFPRLAAAYALSWAKPPHAVNSIADLLDDPEHTVRDQVRDLLSVIAENPDPTASEAARAALSRTS